MLSSYNKYLLDEYYSENGQVNFLKCKLRYAQVVRETSQISAAENTQIGFHLFQWAVNASAVAQSYWFYI